MPKLSQRKPPTLGASISAIRRYVLSFKGLPVGRVRDRLRAAKITQGKWKHGRQLVAAFPKHEVRVFFFAGRAVMTAVQILSK